MAYNCPFCSNKDPIPPSACKCPACQRELPDPPNVRAANNPEELQALELRVGQAKAEAGARGCVDQLEDFGEAVKSGVAVVCRPIGEITRLLSENQIYNTYYNQLDGQSRIAEDSQTANDRATADEFIFPNYKTHIVFAALTLDGRGPFSYGGGAIALNNGMIAHRATVFERNTLIFCRDHKVGMTMPVPSGYRAKWENKHLIAKAKLHPQITELTSPNDYPSILLQEGKSTYEDEFIEVHIYNGFSRGAISQIGFRETKDRAEQLAIKKLSEVCKKLGIELIEVKHSIAKAA